MNYIDLFAGAGGLSEGFARLGFKPVAHVEMMREACDTLLTRTYYYYLSKREGGLDFYQSYLKGEISRKDFFASMPKEVKDAVICETMSKETLPTIFERIDKRKREMHARKIDVVIGGPPCQAYSLVGRARTDMSKDPRNWLYKIYVEFLKKYQPRLFVFENVQGIRTAGGGTYLQDIERLVTEAGYSMDIRLLEAPDFGVLQRRKREIIIGIKNDGKGVTEVFPYPKPSPEMRMKYTVNELLSDLPTLLPGQRNNHYIGPITPYLRDTGIRKENDVLTWHETRPIREFDRNIYRFVIQFHSENGRNPRYTEIPVELRTHKNQKAFLDRFKLVNGEDHSTQTMVAHISKDGHYYIHPDINQARSLSVREAARIQSFPDDYYFEGPRTSVLTQIGNAVPPLLAYHIAREVKTYLKK